MSEHADQQPGGRFTLAGRHVARIGYGAMQLPRLAHERDTAVALVHRAVELGVDHVDTAQFYGDDAFANTVLRDALAGTDVVVATKVGADPNPGGDVHLRPAQRPEELRASVEDNLRSLGRDRVDIVYLRRADAPPGIVATGDQVVPIEDQLDALTSLRDAGAIGGIGLSAVTPEQLRVALPAGIVAVQNAYSLLDRASEQLLDLCVREDIAWVPFFPLGSAFPTMPDVVDDPVARRIATATGATPAQVGLAWLLQRSPNLLLVPGTATAAHLEENLAAGDLRLSPSAYAELDDAHAP
jgi:pyridoxine 4-dehydrogenase